MKDYIIIAAVCYLVGSIHPSYIIGKVVGKFDIRKEGSNNAGASNVTVMLGWKWGVITAACDILKGFFCVIAVEYLYNASAPHMYCAFIGVVFGHIFPFYMGFKGGKGLATTIGAFAGVTWFGLAVLVGLLFGVTLLTGYIGLGTIAVTLWTSVYTYMTYGLESIPFMINAILTTLITAKHFINVKRIIKGEEISLWQTIKKHSKKKIEE